MKILYISIITAILIDGNHKRIIKYLLQVVSACLKLIFDDLLLVFTPAQLQILLTFSKELSEVTSKIDYFVKSQPVFF